MRTLLALDLHPIGSRIVDPAATHAWCAINVGAALDEEPDPADAAAWARKLLPWTVMASAAATKGFTLHFLGAGVNPAPVQLAAEVVGDAGFPAKIKAEILRNLDALAADQKIDFAWDGDHLEGGDDAGAGGKWPWLGLTSVLGALPSRVSRPLGARWHLDVPLAPLRAAAAANPNLAFVISPDDAVVEGVSVARSGVGAEGGVATINYGPDAKAQCVPVALAEFLSATANEPLDDYWLRVTDSRHDSLADLDRLLIEHGDPVNLAGQLARDDLDRLLQVVVAASGDLAPVQPLPGHAAFVQDAVKRAVGAMTEKDRQKGARTFAEAVLAAAANVAALHAEGFAGLITAAVAEWWGLRLAALDGQLSSLPDDLKLSPGWVLRLDAARLLAHLATVSNALARVGADPQGGAVLPGEGIDFLVLTERASAERARLVGAGAVDPARPADLNEMAEFGLLVRRAASAGELAAAKWRMVTAALPVLDPAHLLLTQPWGVGGTLALDHAEAAVARGIALAFHDGVLRNDDTYRGQMMLGPSALAFAHGGQDQPQEGQADETAPDLCALRYVPPSPLAATDADFAEYVAPPLRYGDHYELASFLIDRVGGLPDALCARDGTGRPRPWDLETARVATVAPPAAATLKLQFLRRVPLGPLNVTPMDAKGWPALPSGVFLRATEFFRAANPDAKIPPTLLFRSTGAAGADFPGVQTEYSFRVEAPRLDEHTLQRWVMPAAGDRSIEADAAVANLQEELARIAEARDDATVARPTRAADPPDLLPHDPAVAGILIRRRWVDAAGAAHAEPDRIELFARPDATRPFRADPITIECSADPAALVPLPPAGSFADVEILLLVKAADQARFDAAALHQQAPDTVQHAGETYVLHGGERFLLEVATSAMPTKAELYAGLSVTPDAAGRIAVHARCASPSLAFVDRFEIRREVWRWRSLPYVPEAADPQDTEERRLASGLPWGLAAAGCDTDTQVLKFDAVQQLTHGFATRPTEFGRWPRTATGAVHDDVDLLTDDRDAVNAAGYLRYALTAVSRYAGLGGFEGRVDASPPAEPAGYEGVQGPWRRTVTPFRGQPPLKALNVLAVLPLTAQPRRDPRTGEPLFDTTAGQHLPPHRGPEHGTPVLIVLDEEWHRENGPGEALRAELVLEDREIGDGEGADGEPAADLGVRPLRYGPLPDKHLTPRDPDPDPGWTDERAADESLNAGLRLEVFGPFGYSLDRSGNEAKANATAFLAYLPRGLEIGPHWGVGLRFRRVLMGLNGRPGAPPVTTLVGPPSGAYIVYTLADAAQLVRPTGPGPRAVEVLVDPAGAPTSHATFHGLEPILSPFGQRADAPAKVLDQYRYLLLLGPLARDGGRGVDALLPSHGFWLTGPKDLKALGAFTLAAGSRLQGQILEIELSGTNAAPLESATSLRTLLERLLPLPPKPDAQFRPHQADAVGRITRLSDPFTVRVVQA